MGCELVWKYGPILVLMADSSVQRFERTGRMWGLKGCDSVNPDHVQILVKSLSKYSVSYISQMIKGKSSRTPRMGFSNLKEWCGEGLWTPGCCQGSVGDGWDVVETYIPAQYIKGYLKIISVFITHLFLSALPYQMQLSLRL